MSEKPNEPAPQTMEGGPKARLIVRIVLLAILGIAIVALAYDRLLARPRNQQEFDTVQKLVDTKNQNPATKPITNKDVQEAVGREPSRVEESEYYTMEFYTWPRGLPTKEYFICVVYSPNDKMLLHDVRQNELPDPNTLPGARYQPPPAESGSGGSGQPAGPPQGLSVTTGGASVPAASGAGAAPAGPPPSAGLPEGAPPADEPPAEEPATEEATTEVDSAAEETE
jgi:hypothetical protein